jgi:hypothetical protein
LTRPCRYRLTETAGTDARLPQAPPGLATAPRRADKGRHDDDGGGGGREALA